MALIFTKTTATLATEFINSVPYERLELHFCRISKECGVEFSKGIREFTVTGSWNAVNIAYKNLAILKDSISHGVFPYGDSRNIGYNPSIDMAIKHPVQQITPKPQTTNVWKSHESNDVNNDYQYTDSSEYMTSPPPVESTCQQRASISGSNKSVSQSPSVKAKRGRKPGHTLQPKDLIVPEPYLYEDYKGLQNSVKLSEHSEEAKSQTTQLTDKEVDVTPTCSDSSKVDNQADGQTLGQTEDDSEVKDRNDSSSKLPGIKVEPEDNDNYGIDYDDDTDVDEQYLDENLDNEQLLKTESTDGGDLKKNPERNDKDENDDNEEFKCLLCPFGSDRKEELKNHMKQHKKNLKCEVCDQVFQLKKEYKKHCKTHKVKKKRGRKKKETIENMEYTCDLCSYVTTVKANLKDHFKRMHEKKFICDICARSFGSNSDLKRHTKFVHSGPQYYCQKCQKGYKSKNMYEAHIKTHAEDYVKPSFPCEKCSKSFSTKYVLEQHFKSEHLGIKKAFMCPTCGRSFTQRSSYLAHATVHLGIKPYICDQCGKAFSYEKGLKEHKFLHDSVDRFHCTLCEKTFKQSTGLRLHMKVHKGSRDYVCITCGKAFTQKQALNRHERIHSGAKPYLCTICHKTFNDNSIIRRHMILTHKKHPKRWRDGVVQTTEKHTGKDHPFYISKPDRESDETTESGKQQETPSGSTERKMMEKWQQENEPLKLKWNNLEIADKEYQQKVLLDQERLEIERRKQSVYRDVGGLYLSPFPNSNMGATNFVNDPRMQVTDESEQAKWGMADYQTFYLNSINQQ